MAQIEGLAVERVPPHYMTGWKLMLPCGAAYRPTEDWVQGGALLDKYCKSFGMVSGNMLDKFCVFAIKPEPPGYCGIAGGEPIRIAFCRALARLYRLGDHDDHVLVPEVLAPIEAGVPVSQCRLTCLAPSRHRSLASTRNIWPAVDQAGRHAR